MIKCILVCVPFSRGSLRTLRLTVFCSPLSSTVLGPVVVNGKEMVNAFYAEVKHFQKAPVIERIVLFKMHLILLIVRKQHEFQDNSWKIVSTTIF